MPGFKVLERGKLPARSFKPHPFHVRSMRQGWMNETDKLESLARSLEKGQRESLKVFRGMEIFDGHRRVEAADKYLPPDFLLDFDVIEKVKGEEEILGQLEVDAHRDNYSRTQKAEAFKLLRDIYGMKSCDIAERHHVSESLVSQLLKLTDRPDLMDDLDHKRKTWDEVRKTLYPGGDEKSLRRKENDNKGHDKGSKKTDAESEEQEVPPVGEETAVKPKLETFTGPPEGPEPQPTPEETPPKPPEEESEETDREDLYEVMQSEVPKFVKEHLYTLSTSELVADFNRRAEKLSNNGYTKEIRESHCKDIKKLESALRVMRKKLGMVKFGTVVYNMEDGRKNKTKKGYIRETGGRIFIESKGGGGRITLKESCIKKIDYKYVPR